VVGLSAFPDILMGWSVSPRALTRDRERIPRFRVTFAGLLCLA
jgi:hypothetical protein